MRNSSSERPSHSLNCSNCGAPVDYTQRKCAYCGTFYDGYILRNDDPVQYEIKGGLGNKTLYTFYYMGSVPNAHCLPAYGRTGELWYCECEGAGYAWIDQEGCWGSV